MSHNFVVRNGWRTACVCTLFQFLRPPRSSVGRDIFVLIMSLSLGGMGILSIRNPFAELASIVLGKGDIRSLFCLIVFLIVALVLAYLTNPSETSFRAYLTEQSFRHHLSRLDDNLDDLQSIHNGSYPPKRPSLITPIHFFIDSSPFHFANRASICLRTPKHVFHSFAMFTIAAMIPYSKSCDGENQDAWMISDAWYIGAFGKWWRGGAFEAWYQDVIARSKDEESWTSGILSMKRLDMLPDRTPGFQAHFARGSPPKLRNRERSTSRQSIAQPRSSTPPPLPKSASLPLHAIQRPLTNVHYSCDHLSKMKSSPPRPCTVSDPSRHGTCFTQSRSSATLLEHSPLFDEVLRQITNSKESVLDVRTQLTECQLVSTRSHAVLQHEVDTYRERKQQDDAARLELKSRTKLLDDLKRGAEGAKKDAEKSFKAIQLVRDSAGRQIESFHQMILVLQDHLLQDRDFIFHYQKQPLAHAINDTLEQKKADIQAAEHSVAILNQRSRELEDRLSSERERLRILRQKSENQKSCYPFLEDMDPVSQHYDRRSYPLLSVIAHGSSPNHCYGNLDSCNHRLQGGHPALSSIPTFTSNLSDTFEAQFQSYDGPNCARPAKFDAEHTNCIQSPDAGQTDYFCTANLLDQSRPTNLLASTTSLNINPFSFFDNPSFERSNDAGNPSANSMFDALNPNGLGSALVTPHSSSQSFLRAFAPSPAEREALKRALSSSTNASLEKLPTLGTVDSLPSSPPSSDVRSLPQHSHSLDLRSKVSGTVKFSPWEDEDLRNGDDYVDQLQTQTKQHDG